MRRLAGWWKVDWVSRLATTGAAGVMGVAALLTWSGALSQPDGRLHIWFLDIGQGDGILIQTPSGRQVLVVRGASPQALFSELGAVMPFWDHTLDLAILTHPDADASHWRERMATWERIGACRRLGRPRRCGCPRGALCTRGCQ